MRWFLFSSILAVVQTSWARRLTFINFIVTCAAQGRNDVRWRPGLEASLTTPCSKLRSFWSIRSILKLVLVTLLGFFGTPVVARRRGIVPTLPHPRCAPGAVSCRFLRCCSYMRKAQVKFLIWKWLYDPWHRIQIQIKPKIALKISGYWVSFLSKENPQPLPQLKHTALTLFLWITSVPQDEI